MKIRCIDCEYRYATGKSKRCNICRKRRTRRTRHDAHLRATYGITIDDYDTMYNLFGGACAICGGGTSKHFLATDHDHASGEVRGLLCASCNKVLGSFRDNGETFRRAADYLDNPPSRKVLKKRNWSQFADDSKEPKRSRNGW